MTFNSKFGLLQVFPSALKNNCDYMYKVQSSSNNHATRVNFDNQNSKNISTITLIEVCIGRLMSVCIQSSSSTTCCFDDDFASRAQKK